MKRFISLTCAVAMLICMVPGVVFAEEAAQYAISVDKNDLQKDEIVTVSVGLKDTKIKNLQSCVFEIEYNPDVFEKQKWGHNIANDDYTITFTPNDKNGEVLLALASNAKEPDITVSNSMCWVSFKAKKAGTGIDFKFKMNSVYPTSDPSGEITSSLPTSPATVTVNVLAPATGLELNPTSLELEYGKKGQLTATVIPPDSTDTVMWESSDKAIAEVDTDGQVTAKGIGSATITATAGSQKATCKVNVTKASQIGTLKITGTEKVGETLTASVSGLPEGVTASYAWYRGTTKIADSASYTLTVDDFGKELTVEATAQSNLYDIKIDDAKTDTIGKGKHDTPSFTTDDLTVTYNKITVTNPDAGCEYALQVNGSTDELDYTKTAWDVKDDGSESYTVYARKKATKGMDASEAVSVSVTVPKQTFNVNATAEIDKLADDDVNVSVTGAGNYAWGETVKLTAKIEGADKDNYKFAGWTVTGLDKETTLNLTETEITFTMPKGAVTATAKYTAKPEAVWTITASDTTYDGNAKKATVSEGGPTDITYYIKDADGTFTKIEGAPNDAGSYKAEAVSAATDDYRKTVKSAEFTIAKANQTAEAIVVDSTKTTQNSLTFTGIEGNKYYIGASQPAEGSEDWKDEKGDTITVDGLQPGTEYTIWRMKPGDNNHNAAFIYAKARTLNSYAWAVDAIQNPTFFARTGTSVPADTKTYKITNTGTGAISVTIAQNGDTGAFEFTGLENTSVTIAGGKTHEFAVKVKAGTDVSKAHEYTATLTFTADNVAEADKTQTRKVVFQVADKNVVAFNGLRGTYTKEYDGEAFALTGVTASAAAEGYNGEFTVKYMQGGAEVKNPTDAGTYQIQLSVDQQDYAGTANATLEITKRPLTITGLKAEDKVYDGNTGATVSGGTLNGIVNGDEVSADMPASGTFADKNAGEGKTVTVTTPALTGAKSGNYEIKSVNAMTASISQKKVGLTLTATSKEYDGKTNANVTAAVNVGDVIVSDDLSVMVGDSHFKDPNVGENKEITVGMIELTGTDAGNYIISGTYSKASSSITAKLVEDADWTLTGGEAADYNGKVQKPHKATFKGVDGNQVEGTVTYNSSAEPKLAGKYTIIATAGGNYYGTKAWKDYFEIKKGTLNKKDDTVTAKIGREYTIDLTKYITAPESDAPYTVIASGFSGTAASNDILASCEVKDGKLTYKLKNDSTLIDKTAAVSVKYTPEENTYNDVTFTINITAAQVARTVTVNGMPTEAWFGDTLDKSKITLDVKHQDAEDKDKDKTVQATDPSVTIAGDTFKTVGNVDVTVTYKAEDGQSYTSTNTVKVKNFVNKIGVTTNPAQTKYTWGDKAFKLDGGKLTLTNAGGTTTELDMTDPSVAVKTPVSVLNEIGIHKLQLAFKNEKGEELTAEFDITVEAPAAATGKAPNPGSKAQKQDGTEVDIKEVQVRVVITESNNPNAKADAAKGAMSGFDTANMYAANLNAKVTAPDGGELTSGGVDVEIPEPNGAAANATIVVTIGGAKVNAKRSNGKLVITIPADKIDGKNHDLVVGWKPYTAPSGGSSGGGGGYSCSTRPVLYSLYSDTNLTVALGSHPILTVNAGGGVLRYQWQINRGRGWQDILGANSSSYILSAITRADNGVRYRCVVSNNCGSVISANYTLCVVRSMTLPKTGDTSVLMLSAAMLAAAGGCLAMRKKRD